jgi:hypothetical protein
MDKDLAERVHKILEASGLKIIRIVLISWKNVLES